MSFAAGLDGWRLGGSFMENATESHWQDYSSAAEDGVAVLSAAVSRRLNAGFHAACRGRGRSRTSPAREHLMRPRERD